MRNIFRYYKIAKKYTSYFINHQATPVEIFNLYNNYNNKLIKILEKYNNSEFDINNLKNQDRENILNMLINIIISIGVLVTKCGIPFEEIINKLDKRDIRK